MAGGGGCYASSSLTWLQLAPRDEGAAADAVDEEDIHHGRACGAHHRRTAQLRWFGLSKCACMAGCREHRGLGVRGNSGKESGGEREGKGRVSGRGGGERRLRMKVRRRGGGCG